jgi:very-short-patch-repair endonuclease
MSQERVPQDRDRLARLAARQHGVVTVRQLYSLGFSDGQVGTRAAAGWLHRVHRGIYAVGHHRLTREGHWMAAVLACGDGAVLSHQAAGELWRLRQRRGNVPARIDVAVPRRRGGRPRPGLVVHRIPTLAHDEVTVSDGIPVTTPARTILELATFLPRRQLERAIDEAERLGLCGSEALQVIVGRHTGRRGTGPLIRLMQEHAIGTTATRNEFEERFLALCRRHHLPQPEVNVPLLDYLVDFHWPDARLVVEVDGLASHGTRRAFQADRDRDGRLAVAGYRVLRFTWWDVTRRPAVVADRIRRLLRQAA